MELWDLYDAQRNLTGKTVVRGEPIPKGLTHLVIHICIFNSKGEMLIQQRSSDKSTWADLWDVTIGGSVSAGESSQTGAQRELLEELGLEADFTDRFPDFSTSFPGGFDDTYILHMEPELSSLRLQPEEVQAVRWATEEEILTMVDNGTFIPYSKGFISHLFFRRTHRGNFSVDI